MPFETDTNAGGTSIEDIKARLNLTIRDATRAKILMKSRSLKRTMENANVIHNLNEGILDYISAADILSFACRSISEDNIRKLLLAVDKEPWEQLITVIRNMHYKNYDLYINVIYTLLTMGIPPTTDKVIEMLWALGESPDALLAGYVIEYYNEFAEGKAQEEKASFEEKALWAYEKVYGVTVSVYENLARFGITEIGRILESAKISKYSGSRLAPYLCTIGLLSFSAREIDKGSISKILAVFQIALDDKLFEDLRSVHIRSHSIYIIALYFINSISAPQTLENVIGVVRALGVEPDISVAEYAINFYGAKDLGEGRWK